MKALRFEINNETRNYYEQFNTVPKEILDVLEDGYFDDNGDLPDGNCILVLVEDLPKDMDLSNYEIVEVEQHDYEEIEDEDEEDDYRRSKPIEYKGIEDCDYMVFTCRGYYWEVV